MWLFVTWFGAGFLSGCVSDKAETGDTGETDETGETADSEDTGDTTESGETGDTAPAGPVLLDLLLHDVDIEDREVRWDAQDARGENLRRDGPYRGRDVIVFTDLRDPYVATGLFAELAVEYPHRTNVVGETKAGWLVTENFDFDRTRSGGVAIVSRWDIDDPVQYIFTTPGCGADASTSAGFAYARLDVDGRTAHLLATQLQPDDADCPDAAGTRAAQLEEIRAWLAANPVPAEETFLVAGSLGIDRASDELAGALAALGVSAPLFVGHDALFDPTVNELAALRSPFVPEAPRSEDYVFDRHGSAPQWHNLGLDVRGDRWWDNGGVWSDELSATFPVLAFGWATEATPTTSSHPRPYDAVSLQALSTGAWLRGADDDADTTLYVSATEADDRAWFDLAGAEAADTEEDCLESGLIRGERASRRTHYWTVDGRNVLATAFAEADPALGLEVLAGGCLVDGADVALYRETEAGRRYGHIQTGGEGIVLYFSATEPGELETFSVALSTATPEDWSSELVYRPE